MPAKKELVGHAGNVIADDDVADFPQGQFFIGSRHRAGTARVVNEKLFQTLHGAVAVLSDGGMVVDIREKKALKLAISPSRSIAEASQALCGPANAVHG